HQPVILDATFSREKHRSEVVHMAWNSGAQIVFIECLCPERVLRVRLAEREKGGSISDARLSILEEFRRNYSPPEEIPKAFRFVADTTRQPQEVISDLFISSRRIYTS
ncbi:MAG: AAA family ATPase, partial [Desulfobacterales bacterium]